MNINRKDFLINSIALGAVSLCLPKCQAFGSKATRYAVAVLGDTHFDAEPESVYHSHYDETNQWAKVQHAEFKRNGEMWRGRCRDLLAASGRLAKNEPTEFILQLGDLIQGDCDDVATHKKMLDDCIRLLRGAYPKGLPFLTVLGNHDVRGKGARQAYLEFAETYHKRELSKEVHYPVFSFDKGPDRWIFCDFENKNLEPLIAEVKKSASARHTFLVTHGPFTPSDGGFINWRLGGSQDCNALRPKLYEELLRRHAIVLSGHTHLTSYWCHENEFGGFGEFTFNSVWKSPELATVKPFADGPADYGKRMRAKGGDALKEFNNAALLFRPGIKDYYSSTGAGHYRLTIDEGGVVAAFYPGAAEKATRTFRLK